MNKICQSVRRFCFTCVSVPNGIVIGLWGLVGSEFAQHFVEVGLGVIGLENDMRARFFGPSA
jgi:CDP-paratose 2-epimerase